MSLLLLGHIHTVASSTSLYCSYTCTLHLLFLLHIALFSSNAITGSNDQIHCRHPDYVRSTSARNSYPTCFRRLPLGTPSPVYAVKPIISYFYSCVFPYFVDVYRLRRPNACCYYRRRLAQLRVTWMKSHPVTNSISKMLSRGVLLWGG